MKQKIIDNKYKILELILIFILTFLFSLICDHLVDDEIWNYGFSFNIASGLIPYKDFNMIITPLFPLLGGLFMFIFGKSILVYHIFNTFVCITIFYHLKKISPKSYYIPYAILLFYSNPHYNLFCLMLLLILINMEDKKTNDYLIGVVLGLTFLTKQNIGIFLCFPTLFIKDIKRMFKRGIGFIIPNIIMLIYLLYTNSLYQFIDYTIFGLNDFSEKNNFISTSCMIFSIISIAYLIYKYIKTKDINLIYILCFHGIIYPIVEPYRAVLAFIPTLAYFLNEIHLNKKIIGYAFIVFILSLFSYNFYIYSTEEYAYPNSTKVFKYRKLMKEDAQGVNEIVNYIENIDDELFIISSRAYMLKLEASIPINKYDLLNNGNMGKNGEVKLINELEEKCNNQKCTFLIDLNSYSEHGLSQYNEEIYNFIINKYELKGNISNYAIIVYKNY